MTATIDRSHPMLARRDAAQAVLDAFRDQPFQYGRRDCVRMVAAHLRLLGYKVKLPAAGSYRSHRSALKALQARGFATVGDALDGIGLIRKAPAGMIVGDIVQLPAEHELGGLAIALGNGRIVGFHQDVVGASVLQPLDTIIAAWDGRPAWQNS